MSAFFNSNNNSTQRKQLLGMKRPANPISFSLVNPSKRPHLDDRELRNPIVLHRRALPVYKVRKRLLREIEKHSTLIVIGETGSGKTTQIPQFIHELKLCGDGVTAITQPRRVAAITVAQRVAKEMNQDVGNSVGYVVRFEDSTSNNTRIKYVTDGMLLREAMGDPLLKAYSVIILDEAHERTIHTEVLFVIAKNAQKIRAASEFKPLKIIVMSATMDVDHFSKYFNNAPIIYLEGRQYSVKIFHTSEPQQDYNFACLNTIFKIHKEAPPSHDMLVFLTGQEEIEAMASSIRSIMKDPLYKGPPARINTLYAALSPNKQVEVFQPSDAHCRKIILSTNIAETSITIAGIKYIIDSGKVKSRNYHQATGIEMLKVHPISQAQAWQRAGRAGRDSDGFCYRAYTEKEFNALTKSSKPEILRSNLTSVLLQLLALRVNAINFDFMDKPPRESIEEGYRILKLLGTITNVEDPELTDIGKKMVHFPLDPKFSKIILCGEEHGCVEDVLTVIAVLSGESLFVNNVNRREDVARARANFSSTAGDHVTILNIYRGFNGATHKQMWCQENFINIRNMDYACKVRKQLVDLCNRYSIKLATCGQNYEKLAKCLLSGLFMNIAELQRDKQYFIVGTRQLVHIHPTSSLHGVLPPLVLFTELTHTGKCYIRYLMPIDISIVLELAPESVSKRISVWKS